MTARARKFVSEHDSGIKYVVLPLLAWWLWMPLGATIVWLVKHFVFGRYGEQDQSYVLFIQANLFPYGNPLRPAPLMCIWLFVGLLVTIPIFLGGSDIHAKVGRFKVVTIVTVALAVLAGASFYGVWSGMWDNDKDAARFYSQNTTFYTGSVSPPPSSLESLMTSAVAAKGSCDFVGTADVHSCLKIAPAPAFGFDPRTASFTAAQTVLSNSSSLASQVDVMVNSLHYLPGDGSGQGVWTALLDGSGTRSAEGVAVWDGQSNSASVCEFQGSDSFDRAFGGTGGNSLGNLLAQTFPSLVYSQTDISVYCDGAGPSAKPVIVIPVERQIGWADRTVLKPAGVLVLTGSPSGRPNMTYDQTVKPGQFPCQVYPESIAAIQINDADWAAGRGDMNDAGFGYTRASVGSNSANRGEYVLRSSTDGHTYFVTPLTPRDSDSQAVVAYALVRADEVSDGLNPLSVYVLADNTDPVSLSVINSRMTSYINQYDPQLLDSSGSSLEEIMPFGQGMWRGFVDVGGVTQAYIDVSGSGTVTPQLVTQPGSDSGATTAPPASSGGEPTTAPTPTGGASPGPTGSCGADPDTLTASQLAQCIQQFANALNQREQTPAPTGSG